MIHKLILSIVLITSITTVNGAENLIRNVAFSDCQSNDILKTNIICNLVLIEKIKEAKKHLKKSKYKSLFRLLKKYLNKLNNDFHFKNIFLLKNTYKNEYFGLSPPSAI